MCTLLLISTKLFNDQKYFRLRFQKEYRFLELQNKNVELTDKVEKSRTLVRNYLFIHFKYNHNVGGIR